MNPRSRGTSIAARPQHLVPASAVVPALLAAVIAACVPIVAPPASNPTPGPTGAATGRIPTPVPTTPTVPSSAPASDPAPSRSASLVLRRTSCDDTCGPIAGTVILDDGRVIWEDAALRVLEARLTTEALARVRDEIAAVAPLHLDGRYEATLRPGAEPSGHGVGTHSFEVGGGADPIEVTTVDPSSFADEPQLWIIPPEAAELSAFAARVSDPVAWLGPEAFAEAPRPYVPFGYLVTVTTFPGVGVEGSRADVDDVEWPIGEPIEQHGEPLPAEPGETPDRCQLIDAATAAEVFAAEVAAGAVRNLEPWLSTVVYDWSRGDGWVEVSMLPLLPHEHGPCVKLALESRR